MKLRIILGFVLSVQLFCLGNASASELHVGQELSAQGSSSIEVTRIQECTTQQQSAGFEEFQAMYLTEGMSCTDRQFLEATLSIARITLSITAIGTACSGIASPATLVLSGLVAGIEMVDIVVKNLQCFNGNDTDRNRAQIEQAVCEAMSRQGLECRLH